MMLRIMMMMMIMMMKVSRLCLGTMPFTSRGGHQSLCDQATAWAIMDRFVMMMMMMIMITMMIISWTGLWRPGATSSTRPTPTG